MAFHAEAMSEQKRNPISTLDDAVMWLVEIGGWIEFDDDVIDVSCTAQNKTVGVARKIGDGGFDARGTLMMATRELWEMVNG